MKAGLYICGGPDVCEKHSIRRYAGLSCHKCQEEWAEANPLHHEAIARFVRHEISLTALRRVLNGPGKRADS